MEATICLERLIIFENKHTKQKIVKEYTLTIFLMFYKRKIVKLQSIKEF